MTRTSIPSAFTRVALALALLAGLLVAAIPAYKAHAVAALSVVVTPAPTTAGAAAQYTITFGSGATVPAPGNTIRILFPAGTGLPATIDRANIRVGFVASAAAVPTAAEAAAAAGVAVALGSGAGVGVDPAPAIDLSARTVTVAFPTAAPTGGVTPTRAGAVVFSQLANITNPKLGSSAAGAGIIYTASVTVSYEAGTVASAAYVITRSVTFSPNDGATGATVTVVGAGFTPGVAAQINVAGISTGVRPVPTADGVINATFSAGRTGAVAILDGGDGVITASAQPAFTLLAAGTLTPATGTAGDEISASVTIAPANLVSFVTVASVTPNVNTLLRNVASQFFVRFTTTDGAGVDGCPAGCFIDIVFPLGSTVPAAPTAGNYLIANETTAAVAVAGAAVPIAATATTGPGVRLTMPAGPADADDGVAGVIRVTVLIAEGILAPGGLFPLTVSHDTDGAGVIAAIVRPSVIQVQPVANAAGVAGFLLRVAGAVGLKAVAVQQTTAAGSLLAPLTVILTASGANNAANMTLTISGLAATITPRTGVVGTQISVSGRGMLPNSPLTTGAGFIRLSMTGVTVAGAPPGGDTVLAVNLNPAAPLTDSTGAYAFSLTIPGGNAAQYSPPGGKVLLVGDGTNTAAAVFTVQTPAVTVSPASGPAGTTVTVSGSGWPAGMNVALAFDIGAVGTALVNSTGGFTQTFNVPAGAATGGRTIAGLIAAGAVPPVGPALPVAITAQALFTVPSAVLTVSPSSAAPGDRVTITAQNFAGFAGVTVLTIGGVAVLPVPAPATDASGNVSIPNVLVPILNAGPAVVALTAGPTGSTTITITAAPAARPATTVLAGLINVAAPAQSVLSIAWAQDLTTGAFQFLAPGVVTSTLATLQPNTAVFINLTAPTRLRISGRDAITVPAGGRWIALGATVTIEVVT